MLVVIEPARPLWPAGWLMNHYRDRLQSSHIGLRISKVYSVYATRAEAFAPVRDSLPPDQNVVGMVTFDDPETSMWRPFGKRRIRHVLEGDSAAFLQSEGIQYVLVSKVKFSQLFTEPFEAWLARERQGGFQLHAGPARRRRTDRMGGGAIIASCRHGSSRAFPGNHASTRADKKFASRRAGS